MASSQHATKLRQFSKFSVSVAYQVDEVNLLWRCCQAVEQTGTRSSQGTVLVEPCVIQRHRTSLQHCMPHCTLTVRYSSVCHLHSGPRPRPSALSISDYAKLLWNNYIAEGFIIALAHTVCYVRALLLLVKITNLMSHVV